MRPGVPPWGSVRHFPLPGPLLLGVVGPPIQSPAILGSPRMMERVRAAAAGLPSLERGLGSGRFWELSERFTDRLGLARPPVAAVLRGLRRRGARAIQTMFGNGFLATLPPYGGEDLLDWSRARGIRGLVLRASPGGAHLQRPPRAATTVAAATLFSEGPSRPRP
jgi:pantoate kinase